MSKGYAVVSGIVFGVVAVAQCLRAMYRWPVHIGPFDIPIWFSWLAALVTAALSVWGFRSRRPAA